MTIATAPERCTGCLRCALACSFFTSGKREFNLSLSKVQVEPGSRDGGFDIVFSQDCNECGTCARYCEFGAITASRDEINE